MSDRMMSVAEARSILNAPPWAAPLRVPAARTIVHQAEQIERLQQALSLNVARGGTNALTRFEYMYQRGELLPGDMEPPK